ncbi:DUF308 domain-containing protein [Paenibacillus jamilae]|uniref:DUF308 domain-containing protein n=1 Tax=Paenibacillus jamilae TaxID=114136 RepID=UPI000A55888B|nr:DUF308 domain-containing protein [Paenibacillus jamilae]
MKRFIKRIPSNVLFIICGVASLFIEYPNSIKFVAWILAALMIAWGVLDIIRYKNKK